MAPQLAQKKLGVFLFLLQIVFIVLFAVFAVYGEDSDVKLTGGEEKDAENSFHPRYPLFQDIHIMIFIGFGFLMTFLKRYGFSSVGFNFLLSAVAIQWVIIVQGIKTMYVEESNHFSVDLKTMITGDFGAAAVLISFGVLLGKASPFQLVIMTMVEIPLYAVNAYIVEEVFLAADAGGSMLIHTFGAYFGLACSLVFQRDWQRYHSEEGSVYHSDLFAMIGTVFLWICWPSFNGGLLSTGEEQHRAAVNTYFSLVGCVVTSFAFSNMLSRDGKLDMVHVQNATLAGGVAVGTMANFMIHPFAALIIGSVAGMVSVAGYASLTPLLSAKLKLHDTCGVHNLHGMPGLISALGGVVTSALATEDVYGKTGLGIVFPARNPNDTTPRTAEQQAIFQKDHQKFHSVARKKGGNLNFCNLTISDSSGAAALGVTLGIAIAGGLLMGVILRFASFLDPMDEDEVFLDEPWWGLPDEEPEKEGNSGEYQLNEANGLSQSQQSVL